MRTPPRWLRQLLSLAVLGLVLSCAVAWCCAAWSPYTASSLDIDIPLEEWRQRVPDDWQHQWPEHLWRADYVFRGEDSGFGLTLLLMSLWEATGDAPELTIKEYRGGWPLRCLHGYVVDIHDFNSGTILRRYHAALPLDDQEVSASRAVALRPLTLGLFVDALFYGSLVGLPILCWNLCLRVRKRRLLEAGRCPRCRYELTAAGNGCPECGWGRPGVSGS